MSIKFQEKETMQFTKAREGNANKDFLSGRKRRWATKNTNLNTEGVMYLKKALGEVGIGNIIKVMQGGFKCLGQ